MFDAFNWAFKVINFDLLDLQKTFKILTEDLRTKKEFFVKKY